MKNFICERCKCNSSGFNNQRFCLDCKDANNSEKKKANDKIYYEENKEELRRKERERRKRNYVPHPKKIMTEEERRERKRSYYWEHKKQCKERKRIWRLKNLEKVRKQGREYYHSNPERAIASRKRNLPNRRKNNPAYIKNKMLTDPQFNIRAKLRSRFYRAMKSYTKNGKIMDSNGYGIDYEEVIEHLKPFPKDLSKYHIDHINPLCNFDLTNPEEVRKAFAPENHQWLTIRENLRKSGRIV